ncbi:MAG TPA: IclR family transcriptional regulator [Kiloniellaceae bacterium]|nr:IclR family transcriptional regulator [Kiloniellaceae bacterium]
MARRSNAAATSQELQWRNDTQPDTNFVTALARGLSILRVFSSEDRYLGNRELSERTGIPRPTISRLTQTLTGLGYLRYAEQLGKYQLGPGVLALGYRYLASTGLRDVARPHMQALADASDCAIALGSPDRECMTYLEVCHGTGPLILRIDVGARVPMAETAMGRAYLAALPAARRATILDYLRSLQPKDWSKTQKAVERAVREYEEFGFCLSEGAWNRDVSAVGVPLVLEGGSHVMAFNCGGASLRLSRRILKENLGPRLVDLVSQVEREVTGFDAV